MDTNGNLRYYTAQVGAKEITFWTESDRKARLVMFRWIKMFWNRYVSDINNKFGGSVAAYVNNKDPQYALFRHHWHPIKGVAGFGVAEISHGAVETLKDRTKREMELCS